MTAGVFFGYGCRMEKNRAVPLSPPPLTLSDISGDISPRMDSPPGTRAVAVTLAQIITRTVSLPSGADGSSPVRVSMLNLKGLAAIEEKFGGLDRIDSVLAESKSPTRALLDLVTILANQDLPDEMAYTPEAIGRMLTADRIEFVKRVIVEMTRPLLAGGSAPQKAETPSPSLSTGGG